MDIADARLHPFRWRKHVATEIQDAMRTALRQAGAITAVDGKYSIRERLQLAHLLYDSLLELEPERRACRVRLIDAVFTPPALRN